MSRLAPSSFPVQCDRATTLLAGADKAAAAYQPGDSDCAARARLAVTVGILRSHIYDLCAELEPIKETPHDKLRRLVRELIAACEAADVNCDGMDTALSYLDEAKEAIEEVTWADLAQMEAARIEFEYDRAVKERMELQPAFGRYVNGRKAA